MPQSSAAGIITACASLLTALGGIIAVVLVFIPTMRSSKQAVVVAQEAKEVTAIAAKITTGQLREIHTLVNSNLLAAMRAEYEATVQQAVMMREVDGLNQAAGRHTSSATMAALENIDSRIEDLRTNIDDRIRQTKIAEEQRLAEV